MDLLATKQKIEGMKEDRAQVKGRLSEVQSQLKEKFKVKSLGEAKKLLQDKQEEADALNKKSEELTAKFKEEYGELVGI